VCRYACNKIIPGTSQPTRGKQASAKDTTKRGQLPCVMLFALSSTFAICFCSPKHTLERDKRMDNRDKFRIIGAACSSKKQNAWACRANSTRNFLWDRGNLSLQWKNKKILNSVQLTNPMEQSPSWEANSSYSEESPKVHYRLKKKELWFLYWARCIKFISSLVVYLIFI